MLPMSPSDNTVNQVQETITPEEAKQRLKQIYDDPLMKPVVDEFSRLPFYSKLLQLTC